MPDVPMHELEIEDPATGGVFVLKWPAYASLPLVGAEDTLVKALDLEVGEDGRLMAFIRKMAGQNDVDVETARQIIGKATDPLSAWMAGIPDDMGRSLRAFIWALA
jgi:hypothetical protein